MFLYYIPDAVLIASAIIPAIALLVLVYRADRVEQESPALLLRLVIMGVVATSVAKLAESLRNIQEWKEAEMENYAPDAYKVAKASEVRTDGKYVWLVMSEQSGKIEDIIRSGIGAK